MRHTGKECARKEVIEQQSRNQQELGAIEPEEGVWFCVFVGARDREEERNCTEKGQSAVEPCAIRFYAEKIGAVKDGYVPANTDRKSDGEHGPLGPKDAARPACLLQ